MYTTNAIPMQAAAASGQTETDAKWAGLYRLSAILLIATAVIWTIVTWTARQLYSSGYPADPAAYLQLVAQHQGLANLTWILWIVADLLLMAPTVAIYLVLKPYNRTLALVGSCPCASSCACRLWACGSSWWLCNCSAIPGRWALKKHAAGG